MSVLLPFYCLLGEEQNLVMSSGAQIMEPKKDWVWMLSGTETPKWWDLGIQTVSKLKWVCVLSSNTKMQVSCLAVQVDESCLPMFHRIY